MFLSSSVYMQNIFTYFEGFSDFLLSLSTEIKGAKDADIGDPWPSAKGSFIKSASIESVCIEYANTKYTSFRSVSTRDTCPGGIFVRGACVKGIYIISIYIADPCARAFWIGAACNCADGTCI